MFNCTGPLGTLSRTRDPMLRQLLEGGHGARDSLGIGLEVDRRQPRRADRLWAMGPLTKGRFWEIVAVPGHQGAGRGVADAIAKELGR